MNYGRREVNQPSAHLVILGEAKDLCSSLRSKKVHRCFASLTMTPQELATENRELRTENCF